MKVCILPVFCFFFEGKISVAFRYIVKNDDFNDIITVDLEPCLEVLKELTERSSPPIKSMCIRNISHDLHQSLFSIIC